MRYEMLEPAQDIDKSLARLTEFFIPLYAKSWAEEKAPRKENQAFDVNAPTLANIWLSKAMKIFIAYDGEHPCGYLMGMVFRPLPYQALVFQVEDWYVENHNRQTEDGLFKYALEAIKFIGVDELWVAHTQDEIYPLVGGDWELRDKYENDRYVRR